MFSWIFIVLQISSFFVGSIAGAGNSPTLTRTYPLRPPALEKYVLLEIKGESMQDLLPVPRGAPRSPVLDIASTGYGLNIKVYFEPENPSSLALVEGEFIARRVSGAEIVIKIQPHELFLLTSSEENLLRSSDNLNLTLIGRTYGTGGFDQSLPEMPLHHVVMSFAKDRFSEQVNTGTFLEGALAQTFHLGIPVSAFEKPKASQSVVVEIDHTEIYVSDRTRSIFHRKRYGAQAERKPISDEQRARLKEFILLHSCGRGLMERMH